MKTDVQKLTAADGPEQYARAAALLRAGEVVAMPTETVYGLAANAYDSAAVKKIFEAKGRPQDNPLIVHIASFDELAPLTAGVPAAAERLAARFWPGPLTMVLPKSDKIPDVVTAGLSTVAVRCPSHPVANRLIREAGVPLAAPSANLSGKPSPTRAEHVVRDMNGRVPLILDGGPCEEGVESTVLLLASDVPRVLRPGNVTVDQLRSVLGRVDVDDAVLHPLANGAEAASPGMKYKHYSPDAEIIIVRGDYRDFVAYVNSAACDGTWAMVFEGEGEGLAVPYMIWGNDDYRSMSRRLFDDLRSLDEKGARRCFVRCPETDNSDNLAVLNRLLRAAAFRVVDV